MVEKVLRRKERLYRCNFEPGLYPSIVDILVAMNNKIRERLVLKHLNKTESMYQ